jgi:hemoglobin
MKIQKVIVAAVLVIGLAPLSVAADAEKSLYDRLGGKPAVQAVAGDLIDRILLDRRVNPWFAHAASSPENTLAYKAKLTDFLCQSAGGPCQYSGRDMVSAHKGRGVTVDAFNAVVEDLLAALAKFKVPQKEQDDLLKLLGGLKSSIVQQ